MAFKLGTKGTWPLFIIVAVILGVVVVNTSNKPSQQSQPTPTGTTSDISGDNSEEALKTVSSQYLAQEQKTKHLQNELQVLKDQIKNENTSDTPRSESRLEAILAEEIQRVRGEIGKLNDRVSNTTSNTYIDQADDAAPANPNGAYSGYVLNNSDLSGLGWDDQDNNRNNDEFRLAISRIPGYASIVPLTDKMPSTLSAASPIDTQRTSQLEATEEEQSSPVKTIPARSTLLGAKAMTALIGRVPISGRLEDPYPVKLIVGSNNLASNGHSIHGLDGIIFDGVAKGDWNLGCVSVNIIGGTYIFDDGRIQHLTSSTGNSIDAATSAESGSNIGYISNPQGVPCIPGKRITDAHKQASLLALLSYGSGLFRGRSQSETTNIASGIAGTSTSSVTGDASAFETNAAVADSIDTVSRIYQERIQTTTDVVVAEAGQEVAIHITHDLYIDYQPTARRLQYVNSQNTVYQPTRLD